MNTHRPLLDHWSAGEDPRGVALEKVQILNNAAA